MSRRASPPPGRSPPIVANRIRRHEHTRPDKELDRTRQIEAVGAHTGPVLTVHPPDSELAGCSNRRRRHADRRCDDRRRDPPSDLGDRRCGEHRRNQHSASRRCRRSGSPTAIIARPRRRGSLSARGDRRHGADRFLLVSFPTDQVRILDYNRVVRDLNGRDEEEFLAAVGTRFRRVLTGAGSPERPGVFGMFLGAHWYRLELRDGPPAGGSPADRLDVSLLTIGCWRRSSASATLAPIRASISSAAAAVSSLWRSGSLRRWAVAFALHPTPLADLIAVADAGRVMPPKSTWFEPKLADGLLSLPLE